MTDYTNNDSSKGQSFEKLLQTLQEEAVFKKRYLEKLEELYQKNINDYSGSISLEAEPVQQITILHIVTSLIKQSKTEQLLKVLAKNFPEEYLESVFG